MMICDPENCPNCQYIGEGDSWCDAIQEIVLSDWEPTEHFCSPNCPFLRKKKKKSRKQKKEKKAP